MSDTQSITTSRPPRTRRLLGGLVVVLGLILLADTTGVVAVDGFEVFLAGALVVYGGYRLVSERARHLFWPGTFLLVGAGWLLVEFGVLTGAEARQFWPVLVVLFGASLLRRRRHPGILSSNIVITENGTTDGSSITAVFEDARLDLRGVDISMPSTVEAVAIFGDTEIVVPDDWVVVAESTSIFGTIRDLRRSHPTGEPDLLVNGTAIFGDVRLMD